MKSLFLPAVALLAAAAGLPAQNTPPAPVPSGAGAVAGSTPPAPAPVQAADPSGPVDPDVPDNLHQYSLDRYDKIVEKSPFNFKIVKTEAAPATSFAADLSLAGFTRDVGKGITYASLVDKKKNTRSVINDQSPNKDGIQLVKLNRADTLLSSTVLARKGGEEREIKADEQVIKRKAVVAGGVRGGPPGGAVTPGMPQGLPGQTGPGGRRNDVQQQINQQLQPPVPGPNQPQQQPQGGTANNVGGGGGQPAVAVQPATVAPTVADQAMQRGQRGDGQRGDGQRGDGQRGDGQQPQPNKRRVILPPPVPAQ